MKMKFLQIYIFFIISINCDIFEPPIEDTNFGA